MRKRSAMKIQTKIIATLLILRLIGVMSLLFTHFASLIMLVFIDLLLNVKNEVLIITGRLKYDIGLEIFGSNSG